MIRVCAGDHICLHVEVPQSASEQVGEMLEECGAVAVTFSSAGDEAAFDVASPQPPRWREVRVFGLFDAGADVHAAGDRIAGSFGAVRCSTELLPQRDWARDSLAGFRPHQVGRSLWVCPSWCQPADPGATNIVLDPGLAFGTGQHATTSLCLEWISRHLPGDALVVDYGCGSGILAIAALMRGARLAWGVDIDPRALSASVANAARNQVADRYSALPPDSLPDELRADVVFANIFANVLLDMRIVLSQLVAPNGLILLTGILTEQESSVIAGYAGDFGFSVRQRDGWTLLVGRKQT